MSLICSSQPSNVKVIHDTCPCQDSVMEEIRQGKLNPSVSVKCPCVSDFQECFWLWNVCLPPTCRRRSWTAQRSQCLHAHSTVSWCVPFVWTCWRTPWRPRSVFTSFWYGEIFPLSFSSKSAVPELSRLFYTFFFFLSGLSILETLFWCTLCICYCEVSSLW